VRFFDELKKELEGIVAGRWGHADRPAEAFRARRT
jgi:hypothetical protein